MTLEINEINIQISIQPQAAAPLSAGAAKLTGRSPLQPDQLDLLVRRCVRDVLQHLQLQARR
jgi:hypothetical protein